MPLLLDQNIPPQVADRLSTLGHPTEHVSRLGLAQAGNGDIIRYALDHAMTLVTRDLGIASQMPERHYGLVTLRRIPDREAGRSLATTLQDLLSRNIPLENAWVTVEPGRYRVHTP